jgi:hypothetical protein
MYLSAINIIVIVARITIFTATAIYRRDIRHGSAFGSAITIKEGERRERASQFVH